MPQGLTGGYAGIGALASPQPPQATGPPDPYQHTIVQKAINLIQSTPGISAQMAQQIMSEALGPVQNQIAQRQTTRSDLTSGLTGLAQTAPLAGAQAFLSANYPQMADKPFATSALSSLYGGQTDPTALSPMNPTAASVSSTFDETDKPVVVDALKQIPAVAQVANDTTGTKKLDPNDYSVLVQMRAIAKRTAALAGGDAAYQQAAESYAEQVWASLTGQDPNVANRYGQQGYTPPAAPGGGVGGTVPAAQVVKSGGFGIAGG